MAKGLTQGELALLIFRTRSLISHIEQTGSINDFTLWQICDALNVNMVAMLNTVEEPPETYASASEEQEIEQLNKEIEILRELSAFQQELMERLKQQLEQSDF